MAPGFSAIPSFMACPSCCAADGGEYWTRSGWGSKRGWATVRRFNPTGAPQLYVQSGTFVIAHRIPRFRSLRRVCRGTARSSRGVQRHHRVHVHCFSGRGKVGGGIAESDDNKVEPWSADNRPGSKAGSWRAKRGYVPFVNVRRVGWEPVWVLLCRVRASERERQPELSRNDRVGQLKFLLALVELEI